MFIYSKWDEEKWEPTFGNKRVQIDLDDCHCNKPSESSSFAICPAANTTSSGRGASDDQYSCLAAAISEQTPVRHFDLNYY